MKQRLQLAMAQRRQEERLRKAELTRLDNEDCEEEEEEEEEDMTDESEEEEVGGCSCLPSSPSLSSLLLPLNFTSALDQNVEELLGGEVEEDGGEEGGSVAPSMRSLSPVVLNRPPSTPDLVNTDGTLMLFAGNSCSRTGYVVLLVGVFHLVRILDLGPTFSLSVLSLFSRLSTLYKNC